LYRAGGEHLNDFFDDLQRIAVGSPIHALAKYHVFKEFCHAAAFTASLDARLDPRGGRDHIPDGRRLVNI